MNNIPYGFQSPVLAQKKILENLAHATQNVVNRVTMEVNPCKNKMTNISTVPLFYRVLPDFGQSDHNIPIQDLRDMLIRVFQRTYAKELNSEIGPYHIQSYQVQHSF